MIKNAKYSWVRCPNCNHKLFKAFKLKILDDIEIKCSSCRSIVNIFICGDEENGFDGLFYECSCENTKTKRIEARTK